MRYRRLWITLTTVITGCPSVRQSTGGQTGASAENAMGSRAE